jgi:RNA polymerase sigma-70 factor (family 1)
MIFSSLEDFNNKFKAYYSELVAFANKQVFDLETSQDIVQEIFIYLYENNSRLEVKESIKSYLFKAVFNRCKSHQRKIFTRERYASEIRIENYSEYRDLLVETEFEKHVHAEINKLPERCRQVFMLSRFEEHSNDVIAKHLGISKRTVETQISKALKVLRSKLDSKTFLLFFF